MFKALLSLQRKFSPTGRGSFALARRARRAYAPDQWKGKFTTPYGYLLQLDLNTYPDVSMAFGVYELETTRLIQRRLKPGMWFIDGGANIGYFTLLADRIVGSSGRVDAFEPDPFNRALLEQHLRDNSAAATHVHAYALAAARGQVRLYRATGSDANHGMSSLHAGRNAGVSFDVETVRLDELMSTVPDLIKLDIEGAELSAIEGASAMLRSDHPPDLVVEHNPESARAARFTPGDIFDLLLSLQPKYRVYWIGWRLRRIAGGGELNRMNRQGNLYVTARERL